MSALTPGTRIGPYEVVSAIGAGGMGAVYRARDTRLDRIVALKVLLSSTAADPQLRERFEREARAISSLNHPNICVLHDVGRERPTGPAVAADQGSVEFLVMEYLEGETLAARLTRGPLSLDDAVGIAIQIARALDRAHSQGIVHRDLKPGNVMLTKPPLSSGVHVKLLDFGLARLTQPGAATSENREGVAEAAVTLADLTKPTMSAPLTTKGMILGTLHYMSPEQLEGKGVDARADIFAFGALVYEMIAGRRPFEGKSQASLIGAILDHDPPSLDSLQPATPPLLAELVRRSLAKDPEERWQSARDVLRQLEWIAAHGSGATTAVAGDDRRMGTRARFFRATAIVLCAAAMGGGLVAWALWPQAPSAPPVSRFVMELPEGQNFTRAGRRVLALSPDGLRLVYVANQQLYLRNLNELTAAPISGTGGTDPSEPVFSPDGEWVAFWSNNAIKKVPVSGGAAITLSAAENPDGMSWHGERIVVGQNSVPGIIDVPAAGGAPSKLVDLGVTNQEQVQSPQLIAGARAVLFTLRAAAQGWDDAAIVVQDFASGRRTVLLNGGTDARVLPTGHLIYAREATLFAIAFDEATLTVNGVAKAVQPGVELATAGFTGTAQVAHSPSGTFAFVPGRLTRDNRLVWVDRQGRVERTGLPDRRYQPNSAQMRLSPDGTRVAMTILAEAGSGQAGAGQDIWVWDIARNALTRLSFTSQAASPVWTPDSQRICFNAAQAGTRGGRSASEVLCQAADGSGQPQLMFKVEGLVQLVEVSPDAKWILMEVNDPQTEDDIVMAPLQPGAQIQPLLATVGNQEDASLSPDGRWIAYESNESGTPQIFVRPFPDISRGRWQISTSGGGDPSWSRNGKEVFFFDVATAGASRPSAIMSVAVSPGPQFVPAAPTVALKYPPAAAQGFAEGVDGRFLLNFPASSGEDEGASQARIVVVQNWIEELKRLVPIK